MKARSNTYVVVLLVFLTILSLRGQQKTAFADTKLYEAVLDRLFQYERYKSAFVLRYSYSSDSGELQIATQELKDNQISIEIWQLPHGAPTVWNQLAERSAKQDSELNVNKAAATIIVNHDSKIVQKSSDLGKLVTSGSKLQIPLAVDNRLFLDGSQFDLTLTSLSKDISISLRTSQRPEFSDNPIVRWMAQVRSGVEQLR
jgi:hypothetical protein